MEKEVLDFINENYVKKAKDLADSFFMTNIILEETLESLELDIKQSLASKDYERSGNLMTFHEKINRIIEDNDERISDLQEEDYEFEDEELEDKKLGATPNYEDYIVKDKIAYTLYSDLTHKRPRSFTIEGKSFEAELWKDMLLKTAAYLYEKDSKLMVSFVNDKTMNGRKRKTFSLDGEEKLRSAREIGKSGIYIETNLSANGIKQVIIKMLRKYKIALSDFIIYLRADYGDLHK